MSVVYLTDSEKLPLGPGVRLITSNEDGLVALDKAPGVKSHPNVSKDKPHSLLNAGYNYDGERFFWTDEEGIEREVFLINRLDSHTSGVILLGLNPEISKTVKELFAGHHVVKIYYAIVRGTLRLPSGTWTNRLKKDVYRAGKRIKGGVTVPAKTDYKLVKKVTGGFPVSLVQLFPVTGRTHQLRIQCQKNGHPIVGDRTYGSFSFNREVKTETEVRRMLLHSAETRVKYSFKGKPRTFSAKSGLPPEFDTVLGFRPGLLLGRIKSAEEKEELAPLSGKEKSSALEGRRFKGAEEA